MAREVSGTNTYSSYRTDKSIQKIVESARLRGEGETVHVSCSGGIVSPPITNLETSTLYLVDRIGLKCLAPRSKDLKIKNELHILVKLGLSLQAVF